MTMNKFYFNEHKRDTWKCDWLICYIVSIRTKTREAMGIWALGPTREGERGEGRERLSRQTKIKYERNIKGSKSLLI